MDDRVRQAKQQYRQEKWQLPNRTSASLKLDAPDHQHTLGFCEIPMNLETLNDVELIVEVKTFGLTFRDYLSATGELDHSDLGMECAGIVQEAGCNPGAESLASSSTSSVVNRPSVPRAAESPEGFNLVADWSAG
ncbi:hypothetical protein ETB97_009131 [Aspergillus alliaceus]|nr:hypothetical protein ETB97_009131 [Aspergillus burnettii]